MLQTKSIIALLAICTTTMLGAQACSTSTETTAQLDPMIKSDSNVLAISNDNVMSWNGVPTTIEELESLLAQTVAMEKEPSLRFEPDVLSDYELSAAALRAIKNSGVTSFGFVGNEKYTVQPSD